jgi:hypothetical protein
VHGSDASGGSDVAQTDAEKVLDATARKAVMATIAKEAEVVMAVKEAMTTAVAKEVTTMMTAKGAPDAMPDLKATTEKSTVMAESSGTIVGQPGAAQTDTTLDLKAVAKRPAAMTGSGGSNPPHKRFRDAWRYVVYF